MSNGGADLDLAGRIYAAAHLSGEFVLRSGQRSNEYFDKYLFEAQPELLHATAQALVPLLPADVDALSGLELGGIPIATVLSQITGLPTLYVRKQAKQYGTCRLAEGGEVAGRTLMIIEDVVSTGGAILYATRALRALGAQIADAVCVIDRETGGRSNLASENVTLRAAFTLTELANSASPPGLRQ